MRYRKIANISQPVSELGLGTWVTGGWLWGGSDEADSHAAIQKALECGVTLIDTAPVYGFGLSETIVGQVVRDLKIRDKVILATKCGLEWNEKQTAIRRNSSPQRILKEIDDSRRRLQTDVVDLYQVHWPDSSTDFAFTMETLVKLMNRGIIRAIGLSNFNVEQMNACLAAGPVHALQPSYNLYEREIEKEILPFAAEKKLAVLSYGSLCRGLLSGKVTKGAVFREGDIRRVDPKFQPAFLGQYLDANRELAVFAKKRALTLPELALSWAAGHPAVTCALIGARTPAQAGQNFAGKTILLNAEERAEIDAILADVIKKPQSPAFMAPPV